MATRVGAHEAKTHLADFLNRATYAGERIIVERHGKPIAALVSLNDLLRLEAGDIRPTLDTEEQTNEARFRSDMEAAGLMVWPSGPAAKRPGRTRVRVDGDPVSDQIVADRR